MKSAFLLIDMQRCELGHRWSRTWASLLRRQTAICRAFQEAGEQVVHVALVRSDDARVPEGRVLPFWKVQQDCPGLLGPESARSFLYPVEPYETVVLKNSFSAAGRNVCAWLRERDIGTLYLGGVWEGPFYRRDCCVTQSSVGFAREGFSTHIVTNATNSYVNRTSNFFPLSSFLRPLNAWLTGVKLCSPETLFARLK